MQNYFCFTEYVATCEGWSVWLSLELSKSKEEAKEKHIKRFKFDKFFEQGSHVLDMNQKEKIEQILKNFFSSEMVNTIMAKGSKYGIFNGFGDDFAFNFYVNRS